MSSREQIERFISELSETDRYLVNELLWPGRLSRTEESLQLHLPEYQAPIGTFELLRSCRSLGSVYTKRAVWIDEDDLNPEKIKITVRIKGKRATRETMDTHYYLGINSHDQIYGITADQDLPREERRGTTLTRSIAPPSPSEAIEHISEAIRIESNLKSKG